MSRFALVQSAPDRRAATLPLPHPSWRLSGARDVDDARHIDAREFWRRLGI